jgi:hypothetical protein
MEVTRRAEERADDEEDAADERWTGGVRRHAAAPFFDGDRIVARPRARLHSA